MLKQTATTIRSTIIQLAYFHTTFICGEIAIWSYYTALLLRAADYSIDVVILNIAATHLGTMLGFVLCGIGFSRLGYTWSYRISNLVYALACIISLATLPQILHVHLFIGLMRGLAQGFYWLPHHVFNIKDIGGDNRKHVYGKLLASTDLIAILLPPLAGALIGLEGYDWLFMLGAVFYFAACFMRWSNVPAKQEVLRLSEMRKIARRRGFKQWAGITFIEEFALTLRNVSIVILPFLLLESEFEVGLFFGLLGFFSATIKIWQGYRADKMLFKLGTIGGWIVVLSNFFLIVFWNLPGLVVRSLVSKIGFAFYDQAKVELKYRGREMLLGDFRQQYSLEIQEYSELFLFCGRIFGIIVLVTGFYAFKFETLTFLLIAFAISSVREVVSLWLDAWLLRYLRR